MLIRINKYIADCGICSRRKAEELIKLGKVSVNDEVISDFFVKIDDNDIVKIDNQVIIKKEKKVYIMLNKPKGYITTNKEQFGRKSTIDLIHEDVRVFPIGRLDMYTEGLLLFTNDGQFANYMMHPKNLIKKTYIVTTDSDITQDKIERLRKGVDIGGYITKEAIVRKQSKNKLEIIISEGKNRQVRKMCEALNIRVNNLKRTKIGNLELGNLECGKYIFLNDEQIEKI